MAVREAAARDAAAALEIELTTDELSALEGPYATREPTYFF